MSEGGAQGCQDVSWGGGVPISGGEGPADRHGGAATLNQDCGSAKKILGSAFRKRILQSFLIYSESFVKSVKLMHFVLDLWMCDDGQTI